MVDRRTFFARLGLGTLAAAVVPGVLVAKETGPEMSTVEMFIPVIGPSLAIKDAKGEWVEVKEVKNFDSGGTVDFRRAVRDEIQRVNAATRFRRPEPWYPEESG